MDTNFANVSRNIHFCLMTLNHFETFLLHYIDWSYFSVFFIFNVSSILKALFTTTIFKIFFYRFCIPISFEILSLFIIIFVSLIPIKEFGGTKDRMFSHD